MQHLNKCKCCKWKVEFIRNRTLQEFCLYIFAWFYHKVLFTNISKLEILLFNMTESVLTLWLYCNTVPHQREICCFLLVFLFHPVSLPNDDVFKGRPCMICGLLFVNTPFKVGPFSPAQWFRERQRKRERQWSSKLKSIWRNERRTMQRIGEIKLFETIWSFHCSDILKHK